MTRQLITVNRSNMMLVFGFLAKLVQEVMQPCFIISARASGSENKPSYLHNCYSQSKGAIKRLEALFFFNRKEVNIYTSFVNIYIERVKKDRFYCYCAQDRPGYKLMTCILVIFQG